MLLHFDDTTLYKTCTSGKHFYTLWKQQFLCYEKPQNCFIGHDPCESRLHPNSKIVSLINSRKVCLNYTFLYNVMLLLINLITLDVIKKVLFKRHFLLLAAWLPKLATILAKLQLTNKVYYITNLSCYTDIIIFTVTTIKLKWVEG